MQNKIAIIVFSSALAIMVSFVVNNIKSETWVEDSGCAYYSVGWPLIIRTYQDTSVPVNKFCGIINSDSFKNMVGNTLIFFSFLFLIFSLIFHRHIKNFKRFLLYALIIAVVFLIFDFLFFHIYFHVTRNIYK